MSIGGRFTRLVNCGSKKSGWKGKYKIGIFFIVYFVVKKAKRIGLISSETPYTQFKRKRERKLRLGRRIVGRTSKSNCSVSSIGVFEIRWDLDFRRQPFVESSSSTAFFLFLPPIVRGNPIVEPTFYYQRRPVTLKGN